MPDTLKQNVWPMVVAVLALLAVPLLNLCHYWNHNPLYGYGWFVLLMAAVLLYQSSERLPEIHPERNGSLPALAGMIILSWFPVRIVQIANPDWRVLDTYLLLSTVGVLLLMQLFVFGRQWARLTVFPLLLLLSALPWPLKIEDFVTIQSLQSIGVVAGVVVSFFKIHVVVDAFEVSTPFGALALTDACSGIRSFHLAIVGGLFLGGLLRLWMPLRVLLLPVCLLLAYLINLLRVCVLIAIQYKGESEQLAHDWHDPVGWIVQTVFFAAMVGVAWGFYKASERVRKAVAVEEAALDYDRHYDDTPEPIGPGEVLREIGEESHRNARLLAVLAVACVAVHLSAELWYVAKAGAYRREGAPEHFDWTLSDDVPIEGLQELDIPQMLRQKLSYTAGKHYLWQDKQGNAWQLYWFRFSGRTYSAFAHNIHNPETCLPTQNYRFVALKDPLAVGEVGDAWQHYIYRRQGEVLQLFYSKTAIGADFELPGNDWTMFGRVRQAFNGCRIQEAQMLHLYELGKLSPEEARVAAAEYLKLFVKEAD